MFRQDSSSNFQQIGGGSYESNEGEKKIGKWVELNERFYNGYQITYNGEYNRNGMKTGIWLIMGYGYQYCEIKYDD
ncbi:unnamed protein product [Paramecium sonneborni]|uniref:MORN repeat protein n=1 Tax=Paramecium sonneborni TaxID=65129 RepID=A0A8S1LIU0_9CILI|nr:unnamed protein product [Paramecium sonneborni]